MRDFCTRTFDVVAAAVLAVAWPLLLSVALLTRLDSPGPALFRQRGRGLRSRPFVCFNVRTMHIEPDDRPHCEALSRAANGLKKVT